MSQLSQSTLQLSNPDLLKQQCFIKDGWHAASDDSTIDVSNPFNGDIIGTVPSLTTDDVNDAVTASHEAQILGQPKPQKSVLIYYKSGQTSSMPIKKIWLSS